MHSSSKVLAAYTVPHSEQNVTTHAFPCGSSTVQSACMTISSGQAPSKTYDLGSS